MKKSILFVLVVIIIIVSFFIPLIEQFTISNNKTNKIVFCDSIHKYRNFYISFIHSVNKTKVEEYYKIEGDEFIVYKTRFYSYGAGMPDGSDNPNANIKFKDGLVEIDNINRKLDHFSYMVGTIARHTLNTETKSFKLEKYVEPQQTARFEIKRVSIFNILRRQFNDWRKQE